MGLPWERNWDELCDRFCLAFLTDFRENPSTLSTDGDVVAAEDIALLGETQGGGQPVSTNVSDMSSERRLTTEYWLWVKKMFKLVLLHDILITKDLNSLELDSTQT